MLQTIIKYFKELSSIPRPSYKLDGVRSFLHNIADENKLLYRQDDYGNVVIYSTEHTHAKNIIIQSHMDMVSVKSEDSKHIFDKDPIEIIEELDIIRANKTTLGADNGIGLVCSLLVALKHTNSKINLYLLFTADEEAGLEGADNIGKYPFLPESALVINVDSEIPNQICGGSVGASETIITFPIVSDVLKNLITDETKLYSLSLSGFKGGHSGCDIHRGQYSAIKTMANILNTLRKSKILIKMIFGGSAHNSIPEVCYCEFYSLPINEKKIQNIIASISTRYNETRIEYKLKEEKFTIPTHYIWSNIIDFLMIANQGVLTLSHHSHESLETSNNIGLIRTNEKNVTVSCLTRGMTRDGLKTYYDELSVLARLTSAKISDFKYYDGWNPDWNKSGILKKLIESHEKLFKNKPKIYTAHAGLEASSLINKYPLWDTMSIGLDIRMAHTYREHIMIESIEPFYNWLLDTINSI
jgi:dipeptidase D